MHFKAVISPQNSMAYTKITRSFPIKSLTYSKESPQSLNPVGFGDAPGWAGWHKATLGILTRYIQYGI